MKLLLNKNYSRILLLLFLLSCQPQLPDRTKPPNSTSLNELTLPNISNFTLSNDIPIYLMEKHDVPIVQFILQINAGSFNDPKEKVGLSSFTASLLDEGADGLSSLEIADEIDYLGANLSSISNRHSTWISLNIPKSKLNDGLKLLYSIVVNPKLDLIELNRLKEKSLTSLFQEKSQPNALARRLFNYVLYKEHPFGYSLTESSINNINIEDVKKYHHDFYRPNNSKFFIAGDINQNEAKESLERFFLKWEQSTIPIPKPVPAYNTINGVKIYLIDKPEAAQSIIRIGHFAENRKNPDFFPITVMNTILGGSFTSRLNYNLREKNGFTYGARSYFIMGKDKGPFIALSAVQTNATAQSITEFFNEFQKIKENISQEEVIGAKNYLALGYPNNFESISDYASELALLINLELPLDSFNKYTNNINNVTKNEIINSANKYIDTNNILITIVGDKEKIFENISNLNIGQINEVSIEDIFYEN